MLARYANVLRVASGHVKHLSYKLPKNNSISKRILNSVNAAIADYPRESMAYFMFADLAGIFGTYGVMNVLDVSVSPEFALAFLVSRPLRKIRIPLDMLATVGVARVFPITTQVKLSAITRPLLSTSNTKSFLSRTGAKMQDILDQYGAAYFIGSRATGIMMIFCLYGAAIQGIDLSALLARFGYEEVGNTVGTWAAAVVLSSALYPCTLSMTGIVVPKCAKFVHTKFK